MVNITELNRRPDISANAIDAESFSVDQLSPSQTDKISLGSDSFERAGHDEVDVPSTIERAVHDFESGTLPSYFKLDTDFSSVQSDIVLKGDYSLEIDATETGTAFVGGEGGSHNVEFGDSFESYFYLTDSSDKARVVLFVADSTQRWFHSTSLVFLLDAKLDRLTVKDRVNGSFVNRNRSSVPLSDYPNEKLTLSVTLGKDRAVNAVLEDSNGNELARVVHTADSRIDETNIIQYEIENSSVEPTAYFDGPYITRRTREYLTETRLGITEVGNEVTPSGAVHTGPQELPENASRGEIATAPVTQDATQGEQSLLTLLRSGISPAAYVKRTLDGQGGAYNHRLQAGIGRVTRLNARLSWEAESFAYTNWENSNGGTSVWTYNVNGRPRRIHVEHDGSGGSDDYGGVVAQPLVTQESIGSFRLTFEDVSFTGNNDDNRMYLGLTNIRDLSQNAIANQTGIFYVDGGSGVDDAFIIVDGGTQDTNRIGKTVDWSNNHDIAIEHRGVGVALYIDGVEEYTSTVSAAADFAPVLQLEEETSNSASEVAEIGQVTIEPLSEVLH